MKEQLITLETAKIAKDKGFTITLENTDEDWKSNYYEPNDMRYHYHRDYKGYTLLSDYYADTNQNFQQYGDNKHPHIDAPTQALLQKWLREKHGLHIQIYPMERWLPSGILLEIYFEVSLKILSNIGGLENIKSNMMTFKAYEEALEKGLQEALKLIKQ
jgi:hypothetical protein